MEEVYEDTAGDQQILRRAKFRRLLEPEKTVYQQQPLCGSMASTIDGMYTFPEWNIDWMKEENTVEKSKTPEDRKANELGRSSTGKSLR